MGNQIKPSGWWTTHPTMLLVTVHGSYDGNGDGLGDFQGLREKIDFFKELGISGYKMPHVGLYGDDYKWTGIVQQDWYKTDPHYGTMEEFDQLMQTCKEKDFKIVLMTVPEYVGWHHPDYLAAVDAREKGIDDPRIRWFEWKDDGTVLTCWDRPGLDTSNPEYMDAFLKHIGFWMDKGIAGWDADAVMTWHRISLESVRKFTGFITERGGFITPENMVLLDDITKYGGFNAATGYLKTEFYNELKAITQHKASYIREALKERQELIRLGMFPYQEFGGPSYETLTNSWFCHIAEMYKLQIAFNAALPDQVWILANGLTFSKTEPKDYIQNEPKATGWGCIDWEAVQMQEKARDSIFCHIKRMFSLRAKHKELAIGEIEELETNHPEDVFAAIRTSEDQEERALVIFNFSECRRTVVVNLQDNSVKRLVNYLNEEQTEPINGSVCMDLNLYGFKFLKILK